MPNEAQNLTTLTYADFSGGENSSVPPTSLQDNEFQVLRNLEFLFNKLVTRGGLSAPLVTFQDANIKAVHYCEGTGECIVVLSNKDVYHVAANYAKTKVSGAIAGNLKPRFCDFDGKVFVASGDKLQYYDSTTNVLTTIAASYNCDNVFERFGRLATSCAGDDNIYYSATGDAYETGWEDNSNDDSSSKWLEIGYKSNSDIVATLPIASDIAVFKSNGSVFAISSEYPNWTVSQIAEHTDAKNGESIVAVNGTVAFMTSSGLKTLTTTAMYGNFTTEELARKINRSLAQGVNNPEVYNLVRKRQLIVLPDTSSDNTRKSCYCYQYDVNAGIRMDFACPIYDMQDTPKGTIIASGNSLYKWSFDYATDDGTPIQQEIVTKKYTSSGRLFTRMVDIGVSGTVGGKVTMKWANKVINYTIPAKRRVINVFSVCRDSVFGISTTAKIAIDYIKLYIFEGQ